MTTTPAAPPSFFSRLQTFERSRSYDGLQSIDGNNDGDGDGNAEAGPSSGGASGSGSASRSTSAHASGASTPVQPDMRRAVSMRVGHGHQGQLGYGRTIDTSAPTITSFGAAASTLSPEPLASRHPLFSHHRIPSSTATSTISASGSAGRRGSAFGIGGFGGGIGLGVDTTASSEAGPSSPSPSNTSMSSGSAFSPASQFLSHFSSVRSPPGSLLGLGAGTAVPGPNSGTLGTSSSHPRPQTVLAPDAPGARVLGKYTLGKVLGRGGFSTVRLATTDDGEQFACKIVKRDDLSDRSGSLEKFEEEIVIWSSLPKHPSLLTLLDMERTDYATFLISPVLLGGTLLDVLRKEGGSDKTARKWFPGVVTAVAAMHEGYEGFKGRMMHGDLKLDNFLVDPEGKVMVCDFYMAKLLGEEEAGEKGLDGIGEEEVKGHNDAVLRPPSTPSHSQSRSRRQRSRSRHTINVIPGSAPAAAAAAAAVPRTLSTSSTRGPIDHRAPSMSPTPNPSPLPAHFPSASLPYAPPELLSAPPLASGLAQDIWALGVVLYALLTGKLPFVDAFDPRLQMKILRNQWVPPEGVGKEWIECLEGCLCGDVRKRWTISRVRESDAVLGWREVRDRGHRSRSRSRQRFGQAQGQPQGHGQTPAKREASRSRHDGLPQHGHNHAHGYDGRGRTMSTRPTALGLGLATGAGDGTSGSDMDADPLTSQPRSRSSAPTSNRHSHVSSAAASRSRTRTRGESMTRQPPHTATGMGHVAPVPTPKKDARSGSASTTASTAQSRSHSSTRGRMFRMDGSPVRSMHQNQPADGSGGIEGQLARSVDAFAAHNNSASSGHFAPASYASSAGFGSSGAPYGSSVDRFAPGSSYSSNQQRGRAVERGANGLYFHRPGGVSINTPSAPHTALPASLGSGSMGLAHSPARSAYGTSFGSNAGSSYAQVSASAAGSRAHSRSGSTSRPNSANPHGNGQAPVRKSHSQTRLRGFMEIDQTPRTRLGFGYGHQSAHARAQGYSGGMPNTAPPGIGSVFGSSASSSGTASSGSFWTANSAQSSGPGPGSARYAASSRSFADSETDGEFDADVDVRIDSSGATGASTMGDTDDNGGETARASPTMGHVPVPIIHAPLRGDGNGNDDGFGSGEYGRVYGQSPRHGQGPLAETFAALVPGIRTNGPGIGNGNSHGHGHGPYGEDGPTPAQADRFALSFAETARGRGRPGASGVGSGANSRTGSATGSTRASRSDSGSGGSGGGSAPGSRTNSAGTSAERSRQAYTSHSGSTAMFTDQYEYQHHQEQAPPPKPKSRSRSRTPWDGERYEGGMLGMVQEQEEGVPGVPGVAPAAGSSAVGGVKVSAVTALGQMVPPRSRSRQPQQQEQQDGAQMKDDERRGAGEDAETVWERGRTRGRRM